MCCLFIRKHVVGLKSWGYRALLLGGLSSFGGCGGIFPQENLKNSSRRLNWGGISVKNSIISTTEQ